VRLDDRVERHLESLWEANAAGSFNCPIPGHASTARLIHQEGDLRLACGCTGRWRSVGEVRAAIGYGHDRLLSNIEIATWTRRIAHEAGVFIPVRVVVPELTGAVPAHVRRAREGFELVIGLRWRDGERRPVAYSVRFCAAWTGLPHAQAHEAISALLAEGVIYEAGRTRRVRLYLPGAPVALPTDNESPTSTAEPSPNGHDETPSASELERFERIIAEHGALDRGQDGRRSE
jgi:hypothetical protein